MGQQFEGKNTFPNIFTVKSDVKPLSCSNNHLGIWMDTRKIPARMGKQIEGQILFKIFLP